MKTVILAIMLTGLMPALTIAQSDTLMSLNQAIRIAEQYIRINGFTDQIADTAKMSPEFLYDDDKSKIAVAAKRKNTLHPKAFCISENDREWYIGFLSTKIDIDNLTAEEKNQDLPGKAVIIAKNGDEIRMAHKNALFSKWTKLEN